MAVCHWLCQCIVQITEDISTGKASGTHKEF